MAKRLLVLTLLVSLLLGIALHVLTFSAQADPQDEMASSVNIVGAWTGSSTDTATIKWYHNGTLKKTSTKTIYGGQTTSIYVPSELSGVSGLGSTIFAVIETNKPVNVIVASSNQGGGDPTKGHAYRAMSKEATWQGDAGDTLYAPILFLNDDWGQTHYTSTLYLGNSIPYYDPGNMWPRNVTIKYYTYAGALWYSQTVQVYPLTVTKVELPAEALWVDTVYAAEIDAEGNYPYIQGIVLTESEHGKHMFDYPLKAAAGEVGYLARALDGYVVGNETWSTDVYVMNTSSSTKRAHRCLSRRQQLGLLVVAHRQSYSFEGL